MLFCGGTLLVWFGRDVMFGHATVERVLLVNPLAAALAIMETPGTAIMRRLLDLNFSLMYTCCALTERQTLCMAFDTDVETASPNKLYYGLKELATKADKQDDLLVQDFTSLTPLDVEHIEAIPDEEKEVNA